jgi:CubicO group peptidase (beta-lactamase class C family)
MVGEDRLDVLCRRHVFDPLGMVNTSFNPRGCNIAATEADDRGIPLAGTCHDENARFFGGVSGHAGLFSNIDDVTKFTHMLINTGKIGGSSFLSRSSLHTMIRNYTPGLEECRGIGWCIKGDKLSSGGDIISPAAFGHTGFTGTSIWVDMDNDIYINLLTNRVHPSRENTGIIRFRRLFHNAVMSSVEQDCIIRHLD